jgi:indolepyruvate ferredoxin oxidoreductase beta subunit
MGQDKYPDIDASMALLADRVQRLIAFDASSLAVQAGTPLAMNMVMLGALVQSSVTNIAVDIFPEIIRQRVKPAFVAMNLKAFELGMSAAEKAQG